jgi:hypothetical protein
MKKIALLLVLALGLLIQTIPARASEPPPTSPVPEAITGAGALGIALLALILFEDHSSDKAKAKGNEFASLNDNPAFSTLLKQMAGGSLTTVDILN